jgi:hypothetical protein
VSDHADRRFTLPEVDAPAGVEVGVILLGLDADRLLGGLGLARLADDPASVTQAVDNARHGAGGFDLAGLVAVGSVHWTALRKLVGDSGEGNPGSLRQEWARVEERVAAAVPGCGAASLAYLTACVLRRADVDQCTAAAVAGKEPFDVLPEIPAG